MTQDKYVGYSVEDLLHDQEFVSTVKQISKTEEFEHFISIHIESKDNIIQARKIIQLFQTNEGKLSDERKDLLWENIRKYKVERLRRSVPVMLKTFSKIVAFILILLSIGSLLYQQLKPINNQYQFSASKSDLKSNHSLLVLSNGHTVELGQAESNVTVLKGQEAIQINDDQIVENQIPIDKSGNEINLNEVIIPYGKKSKLILEDGTKVWLNAGSRLAFPQKFNGKKREVFLEGEAYFEVANNKLQPFVISTEEINIEVIGTKFNVSAYKTDNFCETVLLEGKVNLREKNKIFGDDILLSPNQKATYHKSGKGIVLQEELNPEKYIVWIEGWYEFSNENIQQVLKRIERYYNISFEYDQNSISGLLPISGKLDLKDSLDEVMVVLSRVTKFKYHISENSVIIENGIK